MFSCATVYLFAWITISFVASSHAALFKRDSRSLAGRVGVIWLVPIAGAALYLMFGINRIQRRAQKRRRTDDAQGSSTPQYAAERIKADFLGTDAAHLVPFANLAARVVGRPLLPGNDVKILRNGDEAFPEMLRAIRSAKHSVSLSTYIFDRDEVGKPPHALNSQGIGGMREIATT